jgi:hypothetical protein
MSQPEYSVYVLSRPHELSCGAGRDAYDRWHLDEGSLHGGEHSDAGHGQLHHWMRLQPTRLSIPTSHGGAALTRAAPPSLYADLPGYRRPVTAMTRSSTTVSPARAAICTTLRLRSGA